MVCGIDVGALGRPTWVAWLDDGRFVFELYAPTVERPLPRRRGEGDPRVYALDAPQGLPAAGRRRRAADRDAKTPTSTLPRDRAELAAWRLYRGPVVAGVELFWAAARASAVRLAGLDEDAGARPVLAETYPRYVIKRLWPRLAIPSKRTAPADYVEVVWAQIARAGYAWDGGPLTHDHVDAALCALAADACRGGTLPAGTVGDPPFVDETERVLREGLIVSP